MYYEYYQCFNTLEKLFYIKFKARSTHESNISRLSMHTTAVACMLTCIATYVTKVLE